MCCSATFGSQACPEVCMVSLPDRDHTMDETTPSPSSYQMSVALQLVVGFHAYPSYPRGGILFGLSLLRSSAYCHRHCCSVQCPVVSRNTVSLEMSVTSGSYSLPVHPFFQDYPWAFLGGCDMLVPLNIEDSSPSFPAHWPVEGLCVNCHLLQEASLMIERYTALFIAMTLGVRVVLCLFRKIVVVSSPLGLTFLGPVMCGFCVMIE